MVAVHVRQTTISISIQLRSKRFQPTVGWFGWHTAHIAKKNQYSKIFIAVLVITVTVTTALFVQTRLDMHV